jgi:hypothetical protein
MPIATPDSRPATIAQNSDQVWAVLQAIVAALSASTAPCALTQVGIADRSIVIIGVLWLAADTTQ